MTGSQSSSVKHQRDDGEPLEAHARAVWQAASAFLWLPAGWAEENGSLPQPTLDANAADPMTFSVATEDPRAQGRHPGCRARGASLVKAGTKRPLRTTQ